MSQYLALPAWSIGEDCYNDIYRLTRTYGTKIALIGGKTALEKAGGLIADALKGTDMVLSAPIWYGGEASYENAEMLKAMDEVKNADMVFAVGGGRAMDACKVVANDLGKPLFTFPTIASNCAPVTAISIMYHPNGVIRNTYYSDRCAVHCFMHSGIIADAPEKFLWAGIGDSIAKEYESELASRNKKLAYAPAMGVILARAVTGPLREYGPKAMELNRNKQVGIELEECALAVIITAGIASNMIISRNYSYNGSAAHVFYYASTAVPACGHHHMHGELVAFGILVQMALDQKWDELRDFQDFSYNMGLPMTLEQIDLKPEELPVCLAKATDGSVRDWGNWPYEVTAETFIQAILDADRLGREYLAAK